MYTAGARRICFAGYVSMKRVDKGGTLLFGSSTFDTLRESGHKLALVR